MIKGFTHLQMFPIPRTSFLTLNFFADSYSKTALMLLLVLGKNHINWISCQQKRSPFTTSSIETSIITSNVRQKIVDFLFVEIWVLQSWNFQPWIFHPKDWKVDGWKVWGWNNPGWKFGVEKSGVKISSNLQNHCFELLDEKRPGNLDTLDLHNNCVFQLFHHKLCKFLDQAPIFQLLDYNYWKKRDFFIVTSKLSY